MDESKGADERREPIAQEELTTAVEAQFAVHADARELRLRSVEVVGGRLEAVFLGLPEDEDEGPFGIRVPAPDSVGGMVGGGADVEGSGVETGTLADWIDRLVLEPAYSRYRAGREGSREDGVLWLEPVTGDGQDT